MIIDGNAILHRAFHALPPLTDPKGNIVNAVYGFTSMLLRLRHDLMPVYIAVAFDRPAPTFRKQLYEKYQEKRPKMDDTLIPQVDMVHKVVRAMGIPLFEKDGFEADDVIGTLCKNIPHDIDQIIIVTGDRDILQLVEEGKVYVYMPTKGLSEAKLYGEKETVEKMGVKPEQVADFKALAGDASDGYPGVEGIGPKTAVGLLSKYGSIEKLYADLDTLENEKLKNKLMSAKETALLMHTLATIRRDAPIDVDLKPVETIDTESLRVKLTEFGFSSLLKRLDKEAGKVEVKKKENKPDDTQQSLF